MASDIERSKEMKFILTIIDVILLMMCLFVILGCQTQPSPSPVEKPEIRMPEVKPELNPKSQVKIAVKLKPQYVITKVSKSASTWKIKVNQATLKNKNLRVRLQVGYVQYDGERMGNTTSITPDWTPSGTTYVGIWDTQTSRYVSSVRVG
jgi:biopolymer transport protein ExbD